jgi:hypothetical protein
MPTSTNKISFTLWISPKEGIGGEREGDFPDKFNVCNKSDMNVPAIRSKDSIPI